MIMKASEHKVMMKRLKREVAAHKLQVTLTNERGAETVLRGSGFIHVSIYHGKELINEFSVSQNSILGKPTNGLKELQKALEQKAKEYFQCPKCASRKIQWMANIIICLNCDYRDDAKNFEVKMIRVDDVLELFSCFCANYDKQLKEAKEKEVEYAKLVAGQAEEYAEKITAFRQDNVVISHKELVNVLDDVHDKPLKDFINSLLKTHFSEDLE